MKIVKGLLESFIQLATGGVTNPKKRLDICSTCHFKSDDDHCEKCGCILAAKTRVRKATCPVGKW